MDIKKLAQESIAAKEFAYTPYSHFRVGAALLTKDGGIYRGWWKGFPACTPKYISHINI